MNRQIWINGNILPMSEARIDVQDRGYQFADGVYEVVRIYSGRAFTLAEHLNRLKNSADAIGITLPMSPSSLAIEIRKFIDRERLHEGMVYLQVSRGVAERNHIYAPDIQPVMLFYGTPLDPLGPIGSGRGLRLLPVVDERWRKCYIKSIALLANILAKNEAVATGFDEAVFIDEGKVMEGSSTNFFAVIDGVLATPPKGPKILPGITRQVLLDVAPSIGQAIIERPISAAEVATASEIFMTSSTKELMWASHWGQQQIADSAGPVTRRMHEAFRQWVKKDIGLELAAAG